ncbi:Integral membrane protein [Colletotrichum higginsianum IMI 349063]|uniref:Integral membrane protein n=1 Tax=Colletotrichum higginsianum (strain IMI 349063) TaxID=759273 RepID=A0A1B7Y922_COLHI|nr:Integral membrane protein [Colletotrichum higginsianum IMI 349063]OBR08504.1 Integral membrane protein [Colletotrichum higginsianum IMI 349063]
MFNTSGVTTALPAPEGYVVDFGNTQRRSVLETFVTLSVGVVLALLFPFQRLYVKIVIRKRFGVDDEAAMDGYVGVHGWEVPIEKFKDFTFVRFLSLVISFPTTLIDNSPASQYNSYMNPIVYAIPPGACKMVILMFFLEINSSTDWFRRTVYFTMFVVVGSSLGILFSSIFPCNPIQSAYDLATPGTCIDTVATFKATATFGVITDMMIICLPIPMVLNLQVSTRKKIGLLSLFGIGSVTVFTSIVRLYLLITILNDPDQTWGAIFINLWVGVEANLLVMCASLSTLRLFFH